MIEKTHKTLGVSLKVEELSQGMLELYLDEMNGKNSLPIGKYYGEIVRAAVKVGWLVEPAWSPEDVKTQKPAVVRWIGEQLDKLYGEATTVPPE